MADIFKIPLLLTAQPKGGYTVTSPILPELVTEGDSIEEAIANVTDALTAVRELYSDLGRDFPTNIRQDPRDSAIWFESVVAQP